MPDNISDKIEKIPSGWEVKPCPFCGAKRDQIYAEEYKHDAGMQWRVVCGNCMANRDVGYCQTKSQAVDVWNKRDFRKD